MGSSYPAADAAEAPLLIRHYYNQKRLPPTSKFSSLISLLGRLQQRLQNRAESAAGRPESAAGRRWQRQLWREGARPPCWFSKKKRMEEKLPVCVQGRMASSASMKKVKKKMSRQESRVVPKGFVPVCVGAMAVEQRRFLLPIAHLNHPLFQGFLQAAQQEFGFHHTGVLLIPCPVPLFQEALSTLRLLSSLHHHDVILVS
eukprot:c37505_g1_i1 orf=243-845(+)